MKNLKWLLGLPFEITARIDKEYLQFNDAKDDLKDDALKRDAFFASVHTAVALDVLQRMLPGVTAPYFPVSCVHMRLLGVFFVFENVTNGCCVKSAMFRSVSFGSACLFLPSAHAVSALLLTIGTKSQGAALLPV